MIIFESLRLSVGNLIVSKVLFGLFLGFLVTHGTSFFIGNVN